MFRLTLCSTFIASTLLAGLGLAGSSYNPPQIQHEASSYEQHVKANENARNAYLAEFLAMQKKAVLGKRQIEEYVSALKAAKEVEKVDEDKVAKLKDIISVQEMKLQQLYKWMQDREAQVRDFSASAKDNDKQRKDKTDAQRHIEELAFAYQQAVAKTRLLNEKGDSKAAQEYYQAAKKYQASLDYAKAAMAKKQYAKSKAAVGIGGGGYTGIGGGGGRGGSGGGGTFLGAGGGRGGGAGIAGGSGRGGDGGYVTAGGVRAAEQDRDVELEAAQRKIHGLLQAADALEQGGLKDHAHKLHQEAELLKQRLHQHMQSQERAKAAEHAAQAEHSRHVTEISMERLERVEVAVKRLTDEVRELRQVVERIKQHLKESNSR